MTTACQYSQIEFLPEEEEKLARLEERMAALEDAEPDEPDAYERNTYEHFVAHHAYPRSMTIYHDNALMEKATMENSHVVISLYHQRGRFYVDGKVAADWPVSTGVEGRATTPGQYTVLEKKKDHASRRFGVIKSASGETLVADADSRKHKVPAGAEWVGSPMPNWMRLTDYGMGMHTGVVRPGTCLSHGCIRMPDFIASILFDIIEVGWPVSVVTELEEEFPAEEALLAGAPYNAWLYEKNALDKEIEKIVKEAEKRSKPADDSEAEDEATEGESAEQKQEKEESPAGEDVSASTPTTATAPAPAAQKEESEAEA